MKHASPLERTGHYLLCPSASKAGDADAAHSRKPAEQRPFGAVRDQVRRAFV
jgi:hypothetical protein